MSIKTSKKFFKKILQKFIKKFVKNKNNSSKKLVKKICQKIRQKNSSKQFVKNAPKNSSNKLSKKFTKIRKKLVKNSLKNTSYKVQYGPFLARVFSVLREALLVWQADSELKNNNTQMWRVSVILELNRQNLFGLVSQFWDLGHIYKDNTGRYFKFRYLSVGENQVLYQTQT